MNSKTSVSDGIAVQTINRAIPPLVTRSELPGKPLDMKQISVWSLIKHSIGKDLTHLVIPIEFNEPLSFLQRLADYLENAYLIEQALHCADAAERVELIGAFALSALDSLRLTKPFNPLLFETYELDRPELGFRFVAEQVSHHPPISAFHAIAEDYEFYGTVAPALKFRGFFIGIRPQACFTLKLKSINETYTWQASDCTIHNVFLGKMFMSLNGSLNIRCHENGYCLNLDFHGPGKKSTPDPLVCGALLSPSGERLRAVYGSFAEYLASCNPKEFDDNFLEFKRIFRVQYNPDSYVEAMNESVVMIDGSKLLWRAFRKPPKYNEFYKFTYFSMGLNAIDSDYESKLPGTDSRLRPDIRLMEQGEIDSASDEKLRLEIRQRAENALQGKRKEQKRPRYFSALAKKDEFGRDGQWKFEGKYWGRNFSDENLFEQ